ncbi:MAG: high frequency lysogenization protein HflD [Lonepinella koalarum]|nr:high frequency lysogenization protein HflD [Lonepinella koalarum]
MATGQYYEITLALAGICQTARLVQQFAINGNADETALKISISSLLETAPQNTLAVYGGKEQNLRLGLLTLMEQLNGNAEDLTHYWVGLLALSGKLAKNPEAKSQLAHRINYLPAQIAHYDLTSPQVMSNLAAIYSDIISPLGMKIQVKGRTELLSQPEIQDSIRACLLAGIRSAVLWQQVGGSKWQLFFSRRKILAMAQQIYQSI